MKGIVFPGLPFNTDQIYTVGYTHEGCNIYIPVNKGKDVKEAQKELQTFLDSQPMIEKIIA